MSLQLNQIYIRKLIKAPSTASTWERGDYMQQKYSDWVDLCNHLRNLSPKWDISIPAKDSTEPFKITLGGSIVNLSPSRNSFFMGSQYEASRYYSWAIALTPYGAALSSIIKQSSNSSTSPLASPNASWLNVFFTMIQNINDPDDEIPAVFYCPAQVGALQIQEYPIDQSGVIQPYISRQIVSSQHSMPEIIPDSFFEQQKTEFLGVNPLLTNMCCKDIPYYAPHLYLKETNSSNCYGRIQLEDTQFIAGSYYALEIGKVGD